MPFQSQAQRKFMYAKHPDIAKRWEAMTEGKLPEKKATIEKTAFWLGFNKQADSFGDGGSGFSGTGKGSLGSSNEGRPTAQGPVEPGDGTMVDRSMRDRVRGPKDWSLTSMGEDLADDTNPHIIT